MDALTENHFQRPSLIQVQMPPQKTVSPPTAPALPLLTPANYFPFWLKFLLFVGSGRGSEAAKRHWQKRQK